MQRANEQIANFLINHVTLAGVQDLKAFVKAWVYTQITEAREQLEEGSFPRLLLQAVTLDLDYDIICAIIQERLK